MSDPQIELRLSVAPGLQPVTSQTDIAIVIDVLRATSVMTTALSSAAAVFTSGTVESARRLASELASQSDRSGRVLLCGERECCPIEGFDLGNSPAEYSPEVVAGNTLVLTTTNGTRAIAAAEPANELVVASFLNLSAVLDHIADRARRSDRDLQLHLVCSGTNGELTKEDVLLAGAIICQLQSRDRPILLVDDEPALAAEMWSLRFGPTSLPAVDPLSDELSRTKGGRNLVAVGYSDDLRRCARIDLSQTVPRRVVVSPTEFRA
ncbi:MAG: 2-phosphosulfolactate phosphatase [Planctomycetota bacterium]